MRIDEVKSATALRFETKAVSVTPLHPIEVNGRRFTGYSATWDTDLGGDRIERGAFRDSIAEWRAGRRKIRLLDSHSYGSVMDGYGKLVDAFEDTKGLASEFEVIDGPDGDRILCRIKADVVDGMSIGYFVPLGGQRSPTSAEQAGGQKRILSKIGWRETSLCFAPMNPAATIQAIDGKGLAPDDPRRIAMSAQLAALKAVRDRGSLAPDHPERLALEYKLRRLRLRTLMIGIS